jgi:hypothetical protein
MINSMKGLVHEKKLRKNSCSFICVRKNLHGNVVHVCLPNAERGKEPIFRNVERRVLLKY